MALAAPKIRVIREIRCSRKNLCYLCNLWLLKSGGGACAPLTFGVQGSSLPSSSLQSALFWPNVAGLYFIFCILYFIFCILGLPNAHLGALAFAPWCIALRCLVRCFLMLQRYNIPIAVFECFGNFFQFFFVGWSFSHFSQDSHQSKSLLKAKMTALYIINNINLILFIIYSDYFPSAKFILTILTNDYFD